MSPGQLAGATVQDSKAKRQERLKSRFRDRGGIFVPAEGNALAQILLERGVNGESPMKRRSPRKSTTTRSTPKSARTAKVATKTPRTAPKRARKSTVVPDASAVDEPRGAPATKRTNKRPGTSTSKTPKAQSRPRKKVVEVEVDDGGDVDTAPPLDSTTPSRPHPALRPKSFEDRLADALNYAAGHCPDPPSPSSLQGTREEGAGKGKVTSTRSAPAIKSRVVERCKALPGGAEAVLRGPRGDDDDNSDHSDQPLAQKLAKTTPAEAHPKSRKKADTKGTRAKRTAAKAKADTKRTADADADESTNHTAKSALASSANLRKRGAEERRGHEETALPRVCEDLPEVVAPPPTKRARALQEKDAHAPRKRKERAKDVDDGITANNEIENGPPEKKRRRADPTAVSRRRPGKENGNGTEPSKPAPKASKIAIDKPLLSPTGAPRKTTSKGKPPSRSAGTRARPRGLPPDVLRRIKVNAQTLEALQDIDDDDPIDFLRS
ncbi:hypothetical protein V8E53_000277 [Lactarius tabidus]